MSLTSLLAEALFIGHSLIAPPLTAMVETAARHRGVDLRTEFHIINGAPLAWNWEHSADAEGVDARATLPEGRHDIVVMTEAIPLASHLEWSDTLGNARAFYELAVTSRPGAEVYLYETWHSTDSGTPQGLERDAGGAVPWRQRLTDDLPKWQGVVDAVNLTRPKGAVPMRLIPAGQALGRLSDAIEREGVPELDGIGDLFSDDIHLNDIGNYFVALVLFGAITGEDPTGLPARLTRTWASRNVVVTEPMAARMQQIAQETLADWRASAASPPPATAPPAEAAPTSPAGLAIAPATEPEVEPESEPEAEAPATGPAPPPGPGISAQGIGFGLVVVSDWTVQQPFLDVMKTARGWVGHLPGRWGGFEFDEVQAGGWLDERGWLRAIPPEVTAVATQILTDLPEDAIHAAGRYVLTHAGRGTLRVEGRAEIVTRASGRIVFDFTPGSGAVTLTITEIDPEDPLRDFVVVREDRAAALARGAIFNPDWLARLRGAEMIRFMDWGKTNNSTVARIEDRPRPDDFSWAIKGVPIEIMIALANELGAEPWFTIPHLAEDALVRHNAETVRRELAQGLRAYVEFSNEVWNWQFTQATWAEEQAMARWGRQYGWVQFYALRAAEVASIWADTFADVPERLIRVLATQTGWLGLEDDILNMPLAVGERLPPPAAAFDAWAVTGYFAAALGGDEKADMVRGWLAESLAAAESEADQRSLAGPIREAFIAQHRFDHATSIALEELRDGRHSGRVEDTLQHLLGTVLPHQARVAARHGLKLVMYEGGTHVVGMGAQIGDDAMTAFFSHLNYTPGMGALYADLIAGWKSLTHTPFNAYVDVGVPSRWGSWGALRHLGDDNPRWRALSEAP